MNLLDLFVKIAVNDEASEQLDSIVTAATLKGNLLASVFSGAVGAIGGAVSAVVGFGQSIVGAYSEFEQNVGGIETLFDTASDTVIANAERAYETAGVSMNQYMQQATSMAAAMIQSFTRVASDVTEEGVKAQKKALDAQYKQQQEAYSKEATALQRQLSSQYKATQKAYQKAYNAYSEELSKEVSARQKAFQKELEEAQRANAQEVKDFQRATDERLKAMEAEYERKSSLIDAETKKRIAAIDEQIKALEDQGDADDDAERQAERAAKIAELTKRTETEKTAKKRQEAAQELAEYQAKIAKEDRDRERREQIDSLKEQRDAVRDSASERQKDLKDQYSKEVALYKDSRAEMLDALRESQTEQVAAMRESQQEQIAQMQQAGKERLAAMREEQQESLEAMQDANQRQLESLRESQQEQLKALKDTNDAKKKSLDDALKEGDKFVKASEEDYEKAAAMVDKAIIDMSDNANKMGTSLESIQMAYQGFAKGNFMMLDNLKLGFGGTKGEAERLLKTAEDMKAKQGEVVDYSIESFADIVEAIHTVQTEYAISGYSVDELKKKVQDQSFTTQELNRILQDNKDKYKDVADIQEALKQGTFDYNDAIILTGTTSKEANSTIEGSVRSMQAAWDNFLVALADPDTDLGEATEQLVDRVAIAAANIIPRIGVIAGKLGEFIAENGPKLAEDFKAKFMESLPEDMREQFGEYEGNVRSVIDAFMSGIDTIKQGLEAAKGVLDWVGANKDSLTDGIKGVGDAIKFVGDGIGWIIDHQDAIAIALGAITTGMFALNAVMSANPIGLVINLIAALVTALMTAYATNEDFRNLVDTVWNGIKGAFETAGKAIGDVLNGIGKVFEWLGKTAGEALSGLRKAAEDKLNDVVNFFENLPENIRNAVGSLGDLLWSAGEDIMNGLLDGIESGWRWVTDKLSWITDAIPDWKGPASKDATLLRKNGQLIMEGLIGGVDSRVSALRSKLGDVTDTIADTSATISLGPTVPYGGAAPAGLGAVPAVSVSVGELVVREEADIYRIAEQLNTLVRREQEARGWNTAYMTA